MFSHASDIKRPVTVSTSFPCGNSLVVAHLICLINYSRPFDKETNLLDQAKGQDYGFLGGGGRGLV